MNTQTLMKIFLSVGIALIALFSLHAQEFSLTAPLPESFAHVIDTVKKSVVRIDSMQNTVFQEAETQLEDIFLDPNMDQLSPQKSYQQRLEIGSGIIVSSEGNTFYIVSNYHVVKDAQRIFVTLYDGTLIKGSVVGSDPRKDIVVLKIYSDEALSVAALGNSDNVLPGEWVLSFGSPYGFDNTVTSGIVSAVNRYSYLYAPFIQTDSAVNPGNSGGPLFNIKGEVIGMNTWLFDASSNTSTSGNIGLSFAVPVNIVKKSVNAIIQEEKILYGWMGVSLSEMSLDLITEFSYPRRYGSIVSHVFLDSPATRAQIYAGDIITAINDIVVSNTKSVISIVNIMSPGTEILITVFRNNEYMDIPVTLSEREEEVQISRKRNLLWPGFTVYPFNEKLQSLWESATNINMEDLNIPPSSSGGVIITQVEEYSPAEYAELSAGDIIVAVDDVPINNTLDFYKLMAQAIPHTLSTYTKKGEERISITPYL